MFFPVFIPSARDMILRARYKLTHDIRTQLEIEEKWREEAEKSVPEITLEQFVKRYLATKTTLQQMQFETDRLNIMKQWKDEHIREYLKARSHDS